MTSIENTQREEYSELLTYAETVHGCRERLAGHVIALEDALSRTPGGEGLVAHLRRGAGYDMLELAALDAHRQAERDSAA